MKELARVQITRRLVLQEREPLSREQVTAGATPETGPLDRHTRIKIELLETENRMLRKLLGFKGMVRTCASTS